MYSDRRFSSVYFFYSKMGMCVSACDVLLPILFLFYCHDFLITQHKFERRRKSLRLIRNEKILFSNKATKNRILLFHNLVEFGVTQQRRKWRGTAYKGWGGEVGKKKKKYAPSFAIFRSFYCYHWVNHCRDTDSISDSYLFHSHSHSDIFFFFFSLPL